MTAEEIITEVNASRPNTISDETKLRWLNSLEKQIFDFMRMYDTEREGEFEERTSFDDLTLGDEYADMYIFYVLAMTDLANRDISMYNNNSAFFDEMFESWQKMWRRENIPQKNAKIRAEGAGDK